MACQTDDLRGIASVLADSLNTLRNPEQVDRYIECQIADNPEQLVNYRDTYRHYIKATADAFALPPQLFQCILMKESKFDIDVSDSPVGAQGMCQFMPQTRDTISRILGWTNRRRDLGQIQKTREQIQQPDISSNDRQLWQTHIEHDDLLGMWNSNFDTLIEQKRYVDGQGKPITKIPTTFSSVGVRRPQNCIAAAGFLLRENLSDLGSNFAKLNAEQMQAQEPEAAINLMLILGASYNAGSGNVNKLLKNLATPTSLTAMIKALENSKDEDLKEMRDYIKSLRRCLTVGNYEAPERWYPTGTPPTCDAAKAVENELSGTPMRYWQ